jgi:putative heme-binding domain-containing protein
LYGRVAAIFTLKQIAGTDSTRALVTLAGDAAVRAFALRALADRRSELSDVARPLFVRALADSDPRVALEAVNGLRRMGATDAAAAMLPLTSSKDPVIANVTINALAALSAIDASLAAVKGSSDEIAAGALRVVQQIHQPAAVSGLITALSDAPPARRGAILQALARLYNREGVWRGTITEWWGTRPDTTGPYYDPVPWEESARIRNVLLSALLESAAGAGPRVDLSRLATDLQRNRVLPPGGAELLTALATDRHPLLAEMARALVGRIRLDLDSTGQLLARAAGADNRYRAAVARMVVAAGRPTPAAGAILLSAAIDQSLEPELRASVLTALASMTDPEALRRSVDAFSSVVAPTLAPPLEPVWTQILATPAHAANVPTWRALVESNESARQRLGFAVLLQLAADPPAGRAGGAGRGGGGRGRGGVTPEVVDRARTEARTLIDAAWTGPAAASLVWAVGRTGAARYRDRVDAAVSATDAATREAAAYARAQLDAVAAKAAAAAAAAGRPTVGSIPYEDLVGRLSSVTADVALGRKLFVQQSCSVCHTTAANEPPKGPYLGGIFTRYSKAEVIESILQPSAKVAQGFATHVFSMKDKRQLSGFVVREGQDDVVIRDLTGAETTLRKSEIASRSVSEGSVMLRGLVDPLTLQEFASLLAFLESTSAK